MKILIQLSCRYRNHVIENTDMLKQIEHGMYELKLDNKKCKN